MTRARTSRVTRSARWILGLALVEGAAPASAKIGPISLADLARESDHVVVARVASTTQDAERHDWARLEILETWKGAQPASLEVLASPTWTCDITTAHVGETALFFLHDARDEGRCVIAHAGRGRMPMSADRAWARAWTLDVHVPPEVDVRAVGGENHVGDAWVDAKAIERIVRQIALEPPAPRDLRGAALTWGTLGLVAALSVRHALMRRRASPRIVATARSAGR